MTQSITLKKIVVNSILLEMCLPYAEVAQEDSKIIYILDSMSAFVYDFLHTDDLNKPQDTAAIEEAAHLYLKEYRIKFGAIDSEERARNLLTMCIGNIRRNIGDFEPKAQPYYSKIYKALKIRENSHTLPKDVALFGKWLNQSAMKASQKLTIKIQDYK